MPMHRCEKNRFQPHNTTLTVRTEHVWMVGSTGGTVLVCRWCGFDAPQSKSNPIQLNPKEYNTIQHNQ